MELKQESSCDIYNYSTAALKHEANFSHAIRYNILDSSIDQLQILSLSSSDFLW